MSAIHAALRAALPALFLLPGPAGPAAAENGRGARGCEPYGEVLDRARAQWPRWTPYDLKGEMLRSFVAGYNRVRAGGRALVADRVTVFPLHDSDTWYFLAARGGCFVFWTDLAPDVAQGLIENGPRGPGFDDIEAR